MFLQERTPARFFASKAKDSPDIGGYAPGDMLVKIVVDVPNNVSEDERQALEKLRKALKLAVD